MKKIGLLLILFFGITTITEAQILRSIVNSAKNKAEDKAEEKVEEEVDKQVSRFFDSLMEKDSTKKSESEEPEEPAEDEDDMPQTRQSMSNFMNAFGVSSKDVKKKDVYRFNGQIVMITEGTDEDGKKVDPVEYTVSYNDDNSDILFKFQDQEGKKAAIILDAENKVSLILSDDGSEKSGIATSIESDDDSESTEADIEESENDCLAKTGNKRNISGYSCKEYRCENSEEAFSMWVTDDLSREKNRLLKKSPMGASFKGGKVDGMVIQYDWKSKTDKSSSKMTVKEINTNKSSSFSTEGYEIVSFGVKVNK